MNRSECAQAFTDACAHLSLARSAIAHVLEEGSKQGHRDYMLANKAELAIKRLMQALEKRAK